VISIIAVSGFRLRSHHMSTSRAMAILASTLVFAFASAISAAQMLSGPALVQALRRGGYVIVMRHASSPAAPPSAAAADKETVHRERQLDDAGRRASTAMGEAFKRLGIPVGQVLTSPTYRARETARLAGWMPSDLAALGDRGRSMQAISDEDASVLRRLTTADVVSARDRIVITHMPNIARAFPEAGAVADGEALVFKPGGSTPALVGRVKIDEWPRLP
jgi:phosphohistidine phosphatase SixA